MTVREIPHGQHRYIWDTADTKPTAATHGCRPGDTGYDRQTGIMYITYDGTNWVEKDTIVRLETSPSIDIGDVTLLAGTAVIGKVRLVTATGDEITDDTADAIKTKLVDAAGNVIGKAEDAAVVSGDSGIPILVVRKDKHGTGVSADGDYSHLQTDKYGGVRTAEWEVGPPELRADNEGWAVWEKVARNAKYVMGTDGNRQFRYNPWAVHMNGGEQSSGEDWASVWLPVNKMKVTDLDEIIYTYYKFLAGTADVGVAAPNVVICVRDPDNPEYRAEISHTASAAGDVTAGNHKTTIDASTTALFYYGSLNGTPDTCTTEGTNYTWAQYQADSVFSGMEVYMIKFDYGFWGGTRATGDAWLTGIEINSIPVKWEPKENEDLGTLPCFKKGGWVFGEPVLKSRGNGDAVWARSGVSPLDQKSATGWMANLYGGIQSSWDDWSRIEIPVNDLPVSCFNTARWSYYMTEAEAFGINIVIWVHNPYDSDVRAEITQQADIATLEKAAGWDAHELNQTTDQFYYYGEGISNTSLITGAGPTNLFGWDDYQGDECFNTLRVYKISFEYGWHSGDNEFKDAWVADVILNGELIPLKPDSSGSGRIGRRHVSVTSGAVALTLAPKTPFRLLSLDVHASATLDTGEVVTITKDAAQGSLFDTVLLSEDLFVGSRTSYFATFGEGYDFDAADELDLAQANGSNDDIGMTLVYQTVFN